MALPASGAISLQAIQTEFGGSNPISINEYYRGGGLVTDNNTSIPTSGQISFNQFYNGAKATFIAATGGTQTTVGSYRYHTFTGNGTFTVTATSNVYNTIEYLIVAGGGAGGRQGGGGGGAGGAIDSSFTPSVTSYSITIGAGGSGGQPANTTGGGSSIGGQPGTTGGGNAIHNPSWGPGYPGGSGSGASGRDGNPAGVPGGSGTGGQGNPGGNNLGPLDGSTAGGGGGGKGGSGGRSPGTGGVGINWKSLGTFYAGGGGGGNGTGSTGQSGGSGIVILRYRNS